MILTSVTRWLLVVIGCACLAAAQPMSAASNPEATPTAPIPASPSPAPDARPANTIIYPKGSSDANNSAGTRQESAGSRAFMLVVALALAAGGVWVFVKRRTDGSALGSREARKLQIDETRPLGNRQYLVVANYNGKKFLLGVTPGQIQMLTPLDGDANEGKKL